MSRYEVILILGMAVVTFGVRYPVLALVSRIELPARLHVALRYVPSAVLAAIIVPSLVAPDGTSLDLRLTNPYLAAGVLTALIAHRTNNFVVIISGGMVAFWLWRALMSPLAG